MITHLSIDNFVLVEHLELSFSAGMQVLTGETGAGKSLIVGAIELIFGAQIRPGTLFDESRPAVLEGSFEIVNSNVTLQNLLRRYDIPTEENELFVRREIQTNLRSKSFINGRRIANAIVKEFGSAMLDFHSQRDQQKLFDPAYQLQMLDRYAGLTAEVEAFGTAFSQLNQLIATLHKARKREAALAEKQELYRYQAEELTALGLHPGEDEALQGELELLNNAEDILTLAQESAETLMEQENSAFDRISSLLEHWQRYQDASPSIAAVVSHLQDTLAHLEDAVSASNSLMETIDVDVERLEQVEARLDAINTMKAKFRKNLPELLEYLAEVEAELDAFASHKNETAALEKAVETATEKVLHQAYVLSKKRRKGAKEFEKVVMENICQLAIPDAQVKILFDKDSHFEKEMYSLMDITETGADTIEYYFSANKGVRMQPLRVAASGGELSRFLLTLKKVLSDKLAQRLIVFDEIDSGIGGKTAELLGNFIHAISHDHQVLCISHLPQIAACADQHFVIRKERSSKATVIVVDAVADEQRREEIARMLSGSTSELALQHAAEILEKKEAKS